MKTNFRLFCSVLALVLAFSAAAFAQTTGTVEGVVTDPNGGVVKGATVTLTETSSGRSVTTTTSDEGFFTFRSLVPGNYSVMVAQSGFSKATAERVVVQVGTVARADIQLKVGGANENVNVDIGDTEVQVDTTRQTVDGVVNARQITALPLNDRNFLDLAVLQPSVTVVDGGVIDPTKTNTFRAVRVNGGSGTGTRVQIEGVDITDETVGTTVANFSTDAVQEFNLSRSSFDLSTSLTTSGAISIASRTGGNQFNGSGFYFFQDDTFDARPGFETEKPTFNRKQYGYRFGGPFIKDKLFFFSNAERLTQQDFTSFNSSNFSAFTEAATLPLETFNTLQRLDYHARDNMRFFYLFSHSDDNSTGGTLWSPFQNIDWTNVHVAGLNITGTNLTHAIRFGYVNFNNRIASQELSGFEFFHAPGGTAMQVNVGDLSWGPNDLSPQQTYQDNLQFRYDGSWVHGAHVFRWGADYTNIDLGGFANFTGPLAVTGNLGVSSDPTQSVINAIRIGPDAGFFTSRPGHGFQFGDKTDNRIAFYFGDTWKLTRTFTLNLGLRWNYDTDFFSGPGVGELTGLSFYQPGLGLPATYPKDAFSPQLGFAWDPWNDGKTSIRGGVYVAYEANIFNNSIFDENARNHPGIGPVGLDLGSIVAADGSPIFVPGICPQAQAQLGNYNCLIDGTHTIANSAGLIEQLNAGVQAAYGNITNYNPNQSPSNFDIAPNSGLNAAFPADYKLPYSLQFNIGFQREIARGHVLSVDYVRQRGVGLPLQTINIEQNLDYHFFNSAAAVTARNNFLGGGASSCRPGFVITVDQALQNGCIRTNGTTFTPTISNFGVASTTIWPGATSRPSTIMITNGFSLYQGIQVSLNGRFGDDMFKPFAIGGHSLFRGLNYTLAYALGRNESTSGGSRPEFRAGVLCNVNFNSCFGPNGLDRTHNLTISASLDLIGGFRLDQIYRLQTAPPLTLTVPNSAALTPVNGANGIFTVDFNGDGGAATTPRADLLPGTNVGYFGRRIANLAALNQYIIRYNNDVAGHLTPHGQTLVTAGIFTEAQMVALLAVSPRIPEIPLGNPDPFETRFNADYRLSRPIHIVNERYVLEPSFSVFNVFNNNAHGTYTGLTGTSGALNFNYNSQAAVANLEAGRGLIFRRRQLQFGIRFTF